MVWNVHGTGSKNKISAIKEVVRTYKPTVLALVKTHMGGDHAVKLGSILGYSGHLRVNVIGFSGGIWVYWNTDIVNVTPVYEHQQFLTIESSKNGDFNNTRSLSERHGGDSNMAIRCESFNNWIKNCELIELAFTGPSHTWARGNSIETRQSARLDRALCNSD
ncbi:uncharacterized protein LOC141595580 [Silene latifolia]|uniref:uncharacterized protein LOC141595580 n=1 Tax=Silene latifolia TaxID=37657 RepID=UPI003D77144D